MKQFKLIPSKGFFTGLIAGAVLVGIFAFAQHPGSYFSRDLEKVTVSQGKAMIVGYQKEASSTNAVVKGMVIMKPQLEAMNALSQENMQLAGFRVYFGKDSMNNQKAIVVGIDESGKDDVNASVYSTLGDATGLCPRFCDDQSPLVQ